MKPIKLAILSLILFLCHALCLTGSYSQETAEFTAEYKPSMGEKVYIIKIEGGTARKIEGIVAGIKKNRDNTYYMLIEFPERPLPGAPVFLNNKVVGMVYRQSTTGELFEAMPVEPVVYFMKSLNLSLPGPKNAGGDNKISLSDERIAVIRGYIEAREYEKAVKILQDALEKNPDDAELHDWMGIAMMEMGNPLGASVEFKRAISIEPDNADFHNGLGYAMLALEKFEDAAASFKEVLRLNPKHADAHYGIGTAYINLGNTKLAMKEYSILKELDTKMADNLFKLIIRRGSLETE